MKQRAHQRLLEEIATYASDEALPFPEKSLRLIAFMKALSRDDLAQLLGDCGFIPESYGHDSSEEKVYAKAMDAVVAEILSRIGYTTKVYTERSDAADVEATWQITPPYRIVLDGKAFRLSRTALNPKDYKIEALDSWRRGAEYASLVAPTVGFPPGRSRLYSEAIRYNVCLLTYTHLQYMFERNQAPNDLRPVLECTRQLQAKSNNPDATEYWAVLDEAFTKSIDAPLEDWKKYRHNYFTALLKIADDQIAYYETEKRRIAEMPPKVLVKMLINALKIDQRIRSIRSKKAAAIELLSQVEAAE